MEVLGKVTLNASPIVPVQGNYHAYPHYMYVCNMGPNLKGNVVNLEPLQGFAG